MVVRIHMKITIVGCGWLGLELGKSLAKSGHTVYGVTRSAERFDELEAHDVQPTLIQNGSLASEEAAKSDVVIIALPPFDRNQPENYANYLTKILDQFPISSTVHFMSSTGIYPKDSGNYDESYQFDPKSHGVLHYGEYAIIRSGKPYRIFRLGGLFGPERHPIRSLRGRTQLSNPKGKINFVHRQDVIHAVKLSLSDTQQNTIFNLVHPDHPTRQEYYLHAAEHYGFKAPSFDNSPPTLRIIDGSLIERELNFTYSFSPNLFPDL